MTAPDNAGRCVVGDFWDVLRLTTQSRIGLGRSGDSLPTRRVLEFSAAHASARDAVHEPLDADCFRRNRSTSLGIGDPVVVTQPGVVRGPSICADPDLGRAPPDLSAITSEQRRPGIRARRTGSRPGRWPTTGSGLLTALVAQLDARYSIAAAGDRDPGPGRTG